MTVWTGPRIAGPGIVKDGCSASTCSRAGLTWVDVPRDSLPCAGDSGERDGRIARQIGEGAVNTIKQWIRRLRGHTQDDHRGGTADRYSDMMTRLMCGTDCPYCGKKTGPFVSACRHCSAPTPRWWVWLASAVHCERIEVER